MRARCERANPILGLKRCVPRVDAVGMVAGCAESDPVGSPALGLAANTNLGSAGVSNLGERIARDLREGTLVFPRLPHVAVELGHLATSDDPDMATAVALVETDKRLTQRVLWVASSPAFNGRAVTELSTAVMQLGVNGLRDLAFAASLANMFRCPGLEPLVLHELLHAFVVAVGTSRVGRMLKVGGRSRFLSGLFHDIGRLGVLMALGQYGAASPDLVRPGFARSACDALHESLGPAILLEWGIDSLVQQVARHHHAPQEAGAAELLCRAVATVDAADEVRAETESARVLAVCALECGADAGLSLVQLEVLAELVHATREANPMADMV